MIGDTTSNQVALDQAIASATQSAPGAENTAAQEVSPDPVAGDVDTPQGGTVTTLGVMILTGLIVFWGRSLLRTKKKPVIVSRYRQQIPCETCRFKGDNMHLRCAVHPYKAMTAEAMDCPDYWAKDSDRFEQSRY